MPRRLTFIAILFLASFTALAQDFEKQYKEAAAEGDTARQLLVITQWEKTKPKDPEMFIAWFNYYVRTSMMETISLDQSQKGSSIALSDTGTGKPVGYLNMSTAYNSAILQKGFDYIDKAIALYPARLDMRFGKIHMLGEAENFEAFTKEIIRTIEYDKSIGNAWLWKEAKPVKDPKQFFLSSIQTYIGTIYNTENDNLLPNMRQISETVLKYYPDHVESLSNVALTYLIAGDNDKALPYLLKAESIAPKDIIVLGNIAETYVRKNDKANAKVYYEKIIKYGNQEEVQRAKERMQQLNQ